jgi:TP901 family phage tail tape measure protein
VAAGNDLAVAYVQLLPSFDKFYTRMRAEASANATKFEKYGSDAGKAWGKGFAANAQAIPKSTGSAPVGGGASGASAAASALAAGVGAELGAAEGVAETAGINTGAAFAAGLSSKSAAISGLGTALTSAVTVPLAGIGFLSSRAALDFESGFTGVRKTTNATEEQFALLEEQIRATAREIPVTTEELSKIAELGSQSGVPIDDLMEFTRTIADLGVSTNIVAEDAALLLAQFASITQLPTDQFDNLGATIVDLGNKLATTEDRIVLLGQRLAATGTQIGLSQQEILGFSAALSSVGLQPEAAGTAFSRVFQKINDAVTTGNAELKQFADLAGLTNDEFRSLYETDPAALIERVVLGLSEVAESGSTTPILEDLSLIDARIRDSLQRLAASDNVIGDAIDIANTAFPDNTALAVEAEKRYATAESKLQIFLNRLKDAGIDIGEAILPAVVGVAEALQPVIAGFGGIASAVANLPGPLNEIVVGFGAIAIAGGPLLALVGRIGTGFASAGGYFTKSAAEATAAAAATKAAAVEQAAAQAAVARSQRATTGGFITSGPVSGGATAGAAAAGEKVAKANDTAAKSTGKLRGAIGGLNPAVLGLTAAVGAGIAIYEAWSSAKAEAAAATDSLADALVGEGDALNSTTTAVRDQLSDLGVEGDLSKAGLSVRGVSEELRRVPGEAEKFRRAFQNIGEDFDGENPLTRPFGGTSGSFDDAIKAAEDAGVQIPESIRKIGEAVDEGAISPDAGRELINAIVDADKATESATTSIEGNFNDLKNAASDFGIDLDPFVDRFNAADGDLEKQRQVIDQVLAKYPELAPIIGRVADEASVAQDSLGGLSQGFASSAQGASSLERQLGRVDAMLKLSSGSFQAARSAAEAYLSAIENSSAFDNIVASSLAAGEAIKGLWEGGGFRQSEEERQQLAREAAQEQDRLATEARDAATDIGNLTDRMRALNPQLEILRINSEAAASAGNAFRESIENSSSLDDIAGSVISLGDAYKTARKSLKGLPADLDLAAASLGKLKPRQQRAVEGVLALGEATTDYLATLIESGKTDAEVRDEANRLRDEYVKTFRQLGLNEEQINKYLEAMGLTPEQVETAIEVSGIEESRAKLEAYASLLEGKIPGSVAASVIASIEAGDIEGAASQLAQFAATNPIDIPIGVTVDLPAITTAQDALDQLERDTLDIPESFDRFRAALGGYTDAETRGLQALSAAADAAQADIAESIAAGDYDEARRLAAEYRTEFEKILTSFGLSEEAAKGYMSELLGLDEITVENSIELAGVEEALSLLTIYKGVLDNLESFELADQLAISDLLAAGDFEGAKELIQRELGEARTEILGDGIVVPVAADPQEGIAIVGEWKTSEETGQPVLVPATATTELADQVMAVWRTDENGNLVLVPVGADTGRAEATVGGTRAGIENAPPAEVPVGIDDSEARSEAAALFFDIGRLAPIMRVGIQFAVNAGGAFGDAVKDGADRLAQSAVGGRGNYGYGFNPNDIDNNPRTPFATGGYVSGPGTGTSDSIAASLSNGEFVMRSSAVRSLGVGFLDKLNKGYVQGFAMGGLVGDTPAPSPSIGGTKVDYTVVEAKSRPTAEDLVRVTNSAVFLGASV